MKAARDKLPAEFSVIVDIVGGEKKSNDATAAVTTATVETAETAETTETTETTETVGESFNIKAIDLVRLVEADGSATTDDVLISSISSKMNNDVVGGLTSVLNQQGGKFPKYIPKSTTPKADIDTFTPVKKANTSSAQGDSTNNDTATTATKKTTSAKGTRGITGGDVIVAAIDLSLKSGGGIAAIAGAFSYKSEAGAGVEDVVADIKDLQSAAKTTPIKIYLVMNNGKKSKNDIGKMANGVFQVSASQAKIILNAFKPNIDVNKQYFGNGKKVKGKDLLAALESGQDLK